MENALAVAGEADCGIWPCYGAPGQMKKILDRGWKCAIYVDGSMVRRDTLRTSYCRWTSRETATYQRRRSEEHHSRCIPVALGKRGVGTKCRAGTTRPPGTAVRRPGRGGAGGA